MQSALDKRVRLYDFEPPIDNFREEVLEGLSQSQKTLPCKFFYDERGAQLFEQICELEEYYLTRTEVSIMCENLTVMSDLIGPDCCLIEYGSGSGTKTRLLVEHLIEPRSYVPIDISREQLMHSAISLATSYPDIEVLPICADYTQRITLPLSITSSTNRAVYFPGSTIGNFKPEQAQQFLTNIANLCGPGGGLLIGVDLKKDRQTLELAYNDKQGVTAAFNLNLLRRINRELEADFKVEAFRHHAPYNESAGRIEMHLISRYDQTIHIGSDTISFRRDESIITEYSYKYSLDDFVELARRAGFDVAQVWTDNQQLFSVQYLEAQ